MVRIVVEPGSYVGNVYTPYNFDIIKRGAYYVAQSNSTCKLRSL